MVILKGKSDLLYDRNIDGYIGLNDVLLIHENGVREKITRQEHERRIAKEVGIDVREQANPRNTPRSRPVGSVEHRKKDVRRSPHGKRLPVHKAHH